MDKQKEKRRLVENWRRKKREEKKSTPVANIVGAELEVNDAGSAIQFYEFRRTFAELCADPKKKMRRGRILRESLVKNNKLQLQCIQIAGKKCIRKAHVAGKKCCVLHLTLYIWRRAGCCHSSCYEVQS